MKIKCMFDFETKYIYLCRAQTQFPRSSNQL